MSPLSGRLACVLVSGSRSSLQGAGGSGVWSIPPQVGPKPPQIHPRSFLSPQGVSEPSPLAAESMLGLAQLRQPGPSCSGGLVIIAGSKASELRWDVSITRQVLFFGFIPVLRALYADIYGSGFAGNT